MYHFLISRFYVFLQNDHRISNVYIKLIQCYINQNIDQSTFPKTTKFLELLFKTFPVFHKTTSFGTVSCTHIHAHTTTHSTSDLRFYYFFIGNGHSESINTQHQIIIFPFCLTEYTKNNWERSPVFLLREG